MSHDYNIDRQCLPDSGTLTTLDGEHSQSYAIQYGHSYAVHNYCYNDHQMGNGITFDSDAKTAKKRALEFLNNVPNHNKVVANHHNGGRGYYILVKFGVYKHRPQMTVITLLFIGENGSVYQNYQANLMPSDEHVIAAFNKMAAEAREAIERPIREAAEKKRLHEEMYMSGAA